MLSDEMKLCTLVFSVVLFRMFWWPMNSRSAELATSFLCRVPIQGDNVKSSESVMVILRNLSGQV